MAGDTTVIITDKMRVKHGTKIRFRLSSGGQVLEDSVMDIELLGAHLTLMGFMYNGLTMSGGVHWCAPATGRSISRPKWSAELVDPSDELTGDQLCECATCLASDVEA